MTQIFGLERISFEQLLSKERLLQTMFAASAIAGTFLPVLNPTLDREVKLLLMVYGLMGASSFTYACHKRQRKEKIFNAIDSAQMVSLKAQMANAIAHDSITNKIDGQREVKKHILSLPEEEQAYWAHQFGLQGLIMPPPMMMPSPEAQAQAPSWVDAQVSNPEAVEYTPPAEPKPQEDWIYTLVEENASPEGERKHHHLVINGGSQSGKSTLFSKILELLNKALNGQIITNLIDPKYPKTRWTIRPSFVGFDQVLPGVEQAIAELDRRKEICIKAERAGEEHPKFKRYVLIIDEWDSVWGEGKGYGETITKDDAQLIRSHVLRVLKESAAYEFTLVIIGQSPLSGTTGFSRSDLNSASRLVLGNEALKWVQDPGFPFKSDATDLQALLNYWIGRNARCAVVIPNSGSAFVQAIPKFGVQKTHNGNSKDWMEEMKTWLNELGRVPSPAEVGEKWHQLTGLRLTEPGLQLLLESLKMG